MVDNTLFDVARVGKRVMLSKPFYALFLMTLNKRIDNNLHGKTMGVGKSGINLELRIYEEFWGSMTDLQKFTLLLHELMHICLFHITQWKDYSNHMIFNVAADIYINHILMSEFGKDSLPGAEMESKDYKKNILPKLEDTLEQYEKGKMDKKTLDEELDKLPPRPAIGEDFGLKPDEIELGSRHIYNVLMKRMEQDPNKKNDMLRIAISLQSNDCKTPYGHKDWQEIAGRLSEAELKAIETQLKGQLKNTSDEINKSQGNIPGELKGIIDEILSPVPPVFDWKRAIRRFGSGFSRKTYTKLTRLKPNKRYPELPTIKIKHRQSIAVITDTSGSVSRPEYVEFMEQALTVGKNTGCDVTMIECDAYVDPKKGVYELKNIKQVQARLKEGMVTGGGGTSVEPALKYINDFKGKFTCAMYFTDGHVSGPDPSLVRIPLMVILSSAGKNVEDFKQSYGWEDYLTIQIPKQDK
jgi:predicted metal-dependent peptidase